MIPLLDAESQVRNLVTAGNADAAVALFYLVVRQRTEAMHLRAQAAESVAYRANVHLARLTAKMLAEAKGVPQQAWLRQLQFLAAHVTKADDVQVIRRDRDDNGIEYQIFADTARPKDGVNVGWVESTRQDAEFIAFVLLHAREIAAAVAAQPSPSQGDSDSCSTSSTST